MKEHEAIRERYARVAGTLDERSRRAVAASEALALGWGGITAVSRATGLSRTALPGLPQVGIDDVDPLGDPAQRVLVLPALAVLLDLARGRLAHVDGGAALAVP